MNINIRIILVLVSLTSIVVFICNCCNQTLVLKPSDSQIVFSVMGDVPRSEEEKLILQEQISKHNLYSTAQFIFHVGDIKSGEAICNEDNYDLVAGYLKKLNVPVFIIPGDNEWNDCENPNQAWEYWNKYFIDFDQNWVVPFEVQRQENYKVNLSFVQNDVLFIALNLVGGRIHDQSEWDQMQTNAIEWTEQCLKNKEITAAVILAQANPEDRHKLFMDPFLEIVKNFKEPVLFIHGDGHVWFYDDPWILPNLIRVQVDKGGIADPLEITITGDSTKIFKFERYPFHKEKIADR